MNTPGGITGSAFTTSKMSPLAELEPKTREFCERCLDPLVSADGFDFVAHLGADMPMRVIGMLFGIPDTQVRAVRDNAVAHLRNEPGKPLKIEKDHYFDGKFYAEYVAWREQNPSDDLVTELLNVEFEDHTGVTRKLTRDELLIFIAVIAGAGVETTGRMFGWIGKVLGDHPDQRAQVAADRSLIPNTIEELLRYQPPGPHVARYVAKDVEYHGHTVPAGSAMLLMVASANRDERQFEDPERFDIHRKIGHHLTFGYGAHFCLGAALARLEGRIALDEVLDRWPEWEVDLDRARRSPTSTTRGWDSLPAAVPSGVAR